MSALSARVAGATVPQRFLTLATEHPDLPLLHSRNSSGGWYAWTPSDVAALAAQVAQGLLVDRVAAGERVLLMMRNRPDFHWLDLAAQFVRATPVSIYNSSSPEEIQFLAHDCGARLAIVEDAGFLDRILKVRDELPHSLAVVIEEVGPRDGRDDLIDVYANLYVERESQKGIVIGKGGARLREVGTAARTQIEKLLGTKVYLDLRVKIAKNWQRDPKQLGRLGF